MRKKLLVIVIGVLVVASLLLTACGGGGTQGPSGTGQIRELQLVGGSMGASLYAWGTAATVVLNKYMPEITWSARSGSDMENVLLVDSGGMKLGGAAVFGIPSALKTEDKVKSWRGRIIWAAFPCYYQVMVPKDSKWNNLVDIPKGTRRGVGATGTSAVEISRTVMESMGFKMTTDYDVKYLGADAAAQAFVEGQLDAFGWCMGWPNPGAIQAAASKRGVKVLPMTVEQQQKVIKDYPLLGLLPGKIPGGIVDGVPNDVLTIQSPNVYFVRDDFPEDVAYKMTKIIYEHQAELEKLYGASRDTKPAYLAQLDKNTIYKAHPGAIKYLKEVGAY